MSKHKRKREGSRKNAQASGWAGERASEQTSQQTSAIAIDGAGHSYMAASQDTTPSILSAQDIHKSYGKKEVVRGVNFTITQGKAIGFLGPNGAGKTTIFHILVGFIKANKGTIMLNDTTLNGIPMYKRAQLGITYLPQESSIFRKLTVAQNILAVLQLRGDLDHHQKQQVLSELLHTFGIEKNRHQKAYTLSGGERRRVEIARALAISPKFLLLDEPFTGIDPIAVGDIKTIVRDLCQLGIGVLITDHNARDTLEITDFSYIITDGNIIASGSRDEIINNPLAKQVYLGSTFDD